MKRFQVVTILLVFLFGISIGGTTELSLDDYLKEAINNHPLTQMAKAQYISVVKKNLSVQGLKDWNLFLSSTYSGGYGIDGSTTFEPKSTIFINNAKISKIFTDTGTTIQIGGTYSSMKELPSMLGGSNYNIYGLNFELSVIQPLLKNTFGKLDRYPLKLAEFGNKLAEIKYAEDLEDLKVALSTDYLNWQFDYLSLKIYKEQLDQAVEQVSLIERQLKSGVSEKIDLVQANQNLQAKKMAYLSASEEFAKETIIINSRIGKPALENGVYPSVEINSIKILPKDDAIKYFKKQSNIVKILNLTEDMQKETLAISKSSLDPSLELFYSKKLGSSELSQEDTFNNVGKKSPYSIGIQFSTPIGNTAAISEYESSEQELIRIQKTNQNTITDTINNIKALYSSIWYIDTQLDEIKKLISLSQEYATLEEQKYKQGRSSIFFLLNSQGQILSTKLQEQGLKYRKALLLNTLSAILDLDQNKGDQ